MSRSTARKRWTVIVGLIVGAALVAGGGAFAYGLYKSEKRSEAECAEVARLNAALTDPIGDGTPVTVVGDSYSQGWGLEDPRSSWVSQLDGYSITVDAASSAGYTHGGLCDLPSIPDLADDVAGALIIQAGINDTQASSDDLAAAVRDALAAHQGEAVALVGPAPAPSLDQNAVAAVDAVLARVAEEEGALYVSALSWTDLQFGADGLHLSESGHVLFGQRVVDAIAP